ncbi:uncharacterized protein LOC131060069 [Cryptomeria japonica]|uniref:uncharacterized protein LOC131060069 n=1 Tax=Cryptomeria japonica TaxID=3369 RepID=UPI0027DA7E62|nr:uncharacterized protein LOC131060069 [Cryptomeria japonica]
MYIASIEKDERANTHNGQSLQQGGVIKNALQPEVRLALFDVALTLLEHINAGDLDGRESNTEHIDIDLANVKWNENEPLPKEDTKLEDFADGDGTLTHKREIGISLASDGEFVHYSSQAEEVNGDVGLKISDPLDHTPDSIKAEVVSRKGLYEGKIESDSLDCNFGGNNSWENAGKNKIQNSLLVSLQEGLDQRDNVDTKVFLHTLTLPEAEKSEEKEKGEESNKHGKGLGEKQCLWDLTKDASSFIHSLGNSSEPFVTETTTVFPFSQNAVTNSCLTENVLQGACQIVPEQVADRISGSRGYAKSTSITSLPSIGLQRQEAPFYTSNLYCSHHKNSSMPLKRKACFGWLSDDENSPERSDTARLSNDDFGKIKEIGSNAMATARGICLIESDSSEKNKELEKNIMLSIEKQLPDKFSSEYNCTGIEEDTRRLADRPFQPRTSLSKDTGQKFNRDKYEQTEVLPNLRHRNEINDEPSWKFRKLDMDENIGVSRFFRASHKKQSSHEHETHRSDHRNGRTDGKDSWQLTNNNSYDKRTSYHSWKEYQRVEPRKNDWHGQTIINQHLEQGISCNQQGNFCEDHYRQEYKRNSEKVNIISYNKKYTDDEGYGRQNYTESINVTGKSSLLHEKRGFQHPKSGHNHHRGNGKVGDKFHLFNMPVALSHTQFRNDSYTLPPKNHYKMRRWDVKPDFIKRR